MQENIRSTKCNIKKEPQKKRKKKKKGKKNNSLKCLILNPPIDHARNTVNKMEINILKDKVNFRHLNSKICNKQKKIECKHIKRKGNIAISKQSTYKQKSIKKLISKNSEQNVYIKLNQ